LSRPFPSQRNSSPASFIRVNGKIRAREVRVIGVDGTQLGVISLTEAINLARQHGVDLVEIAATAVPPVCRLVDFGKYRYEIAKKEKESKKHQHASTVKEVQLSPRIDPHDLGIKVAHAIDFLCEDMKVKVALKFRGREMAHTEVGFEVINKFIELIAPFGHPDFAPKLVGRAINLMISPLPRNKRAKNPRAVEEDAAPGQQSAPAKNNHHEKPPAPKPGPSAPGSAPAPVPPKVKIPVAEQPQSGGLSNPFASLELK
jgi:translation initiation factor IF-3